MTTATKKAAPRPVSLRGCLTTDRTLVLPPGKVDRISHLAIHGNGSVGVEACENPARARPSHRRRPASLDPWWSWWGTRCGVMRHCF